MDTVSVSQGVFAFQGSYKIGERKNRPKKDALFSEPWYAAYKEAWSTIENTVEKTNSKMFAQILEDLKSYVTTIDYNTLSDEIPTAILMTGVNLPDHETLFQIIASKFRDITSHVSIVQQRDSSTLERMVEGTIYNLVNSSENNDLEIKKNQCTFRVLNAWYQERKPKKPLLIIVPDFESFSANVLQDFILILSVYAKTIKFVLIFGVATQVDAVHRSLPRHVTSKLQVKVFHTQTEVKSLSNVLEGTVLSVETPFKLTGRAFRLLTDIFLFYDFSVKGFLQGYKLCMMQHFYQNNYTSLCCDAKIVKSRIDQLTRNDLNEIKQLDSVAKYMQKFSKDGRKSLDDHEFKELLFTLIKRIHTFTRAFTVILRCLHRLTADLPNAPLGKQLREVYSKAVSSAISESEEYNECLKLLGFLSKEELLKKLESMEIIIERSEAVDMFGDVKQNLEKHKDILVNASTEVTQDSTELVDVDEKLTRIQLKEKLLKLSQKHSLSPYKRAQSDFMNYLDREIFSVYLKNPSLLPANEIFFYNDVSAVKNHIVGSQRTTINTGLNNPQTYLDCSCCHLDTERSMLPTLPDLSIVYKLHLECGKHINIYDWLQAFLTVVSPDESAEERRDIDAELQARFTRAVAELEFLGFIKSSSKKTDHAMRLTWGSS